jgi:hypothetical protein
MRSFVLLLCIIFFAIGIYIGKKSCKPKLYTQTESTIMLEKIRDVFKLAFVEAQFSELYNHKDYRWFDIAPFRKTAIIRVRATVTAGINMDSARINANEANKTIYLKFNHTPEILALDHTLDYYDLQQGTFNSFNSTELSTMQDKAKELIRTKAFESDLMSRAALKRDEMINLLQQFVKATGWNLVVEDSHIQIPFKQ